MTIPATSPLAVVAVTDVSTQYQVQVSSALGLPLGALPSGQGLTVAGCLTAAGVEIAGLNATFTGGAVVVTGTNTFVIGATYVAGYASGGCVWIKGAGVPAAIITKFDSNLSTRAADKTGDALFGPIVLQKSPGMVVSTPTSSIVTNSPGSQIATATTSDKYVLGDNDDVQLVPSRSRTIMVSVLEAMNEFGSEGIVFGQTLTTSMGAISASNGTTNQNIQKFWIPLTRLHDGATLSSATLLFFPGPGTASFFAPTVLPTFNVVRFDPSVDTTLTSLATAGASVFPTPSSAASYAQTVAVGSTGTFQLATLNLAAATLSAGNTLTDPANNTFQITTSGTYQNGDPVPIQAIAPTAPAVFYGANTNDAPGTVLTWTTAPSNCQATQAVGPAGMTGGLNAGYAQTLVLTPDASMSLIDQSRYVYIATITDDNWATINTFGNTTLNTVYSAIKLEFSGITSLAPQ